ncbi:MAG TPA: hypothetical protein VGB01_01440 [candidate division Zixibacteria bacterium]|jgi:hypothetical protein
MKTSGIKPTLQTPLSGKEIGDPKMVALQKTKVKVRSNYFSGVNRNKNYYRISIVLMGKENSGLLIENNWPQPSG